MNVLPVNHVPQKTIWVYGSVGGIITSATWSNFKDVAELEFFKLKKSVIQTHHMQAFYFSYMVEESLAKNDIDSLVKDLFFEKCRDVTFVSNPNVISYPYTPDAWMYIVESGWD